MVVPEWLERSYGGLAPYLQYIVVYNIGGCMGKKSPKVVETPYGFGVVVDGRVHMWSAVSPLRGKGGEDLLRGLLGRMCAVRGWGWDAPVPPPNEESVDWDGILEENVHGAGSECGS